MTDDAPPEDEDIEATPEMVREGVWALLSYRQDSSDSDIVTAVYTAMRLARRRSVSEGEQ